jgi:hypothetical protein
LILLLLYAIEQGRIKTRIKKHQHDSKSKTYLLNFRYNGNTTIGSTLFARDFSTFVLGHAIIKQKRVSSKSCIQKANLPMLKECYSDYLGFNEEKLDYTVNWTSAINESTIDGVSMAYKYNSSTVLKDNPYFGIYTSYMGGKLFCFIWSCIIKSILLNLRFYSFAKIMPYEIYSLKLLVLREFG